MQNIGRLQHKRIYEPSEPDDGMRILIDRLWPRGVRKEDARFEVWLKDIAPSPDLRKWFCHDESLFDTFQTLYEKELVEDDAHRRAVRQVVDWLKQGPVTLLFAAKDVEYNHAVVLHKFLLEHLNNGDSLGMNHESG